MKIQFKIIPILLLLLFNISILAQNENEETRLFIRVYNMEGEKINKGYFKFINDNMLGIKRNNKLVQVNINDIGYIKTKRSGGHNVLLGSMSGLAAGMIIGAATSDQETKTRDGGFLFGTYEYKTGTSPGTGAAIGGLIGLAGGGLVGAVGTSFRESNTYTINGDINNLRAFSASLSK